MSNNYTPYSLFEQAAKLYPEDTCVIFENNKLTYKELETEISKTHHAILHSAKNENIIGLPTTRGIFQLVFMLAILKAGKAYLPIDFSYPKSRLKSIIKNSEISFCLSSKSDETHVLDMGLKLISDTPVNVINGVDQTSTSQNSTYILYTSGSTGEPKGVCMGGEASTNLIHWQNKNSISKRGTRTLQFAPLTFDVSFQEIMSTLSTGGTLVLIHEDLRLDMIALLNLIVTKKINRLFLPFVALQALAEVAISLDTYPSSLNEIMTAGEQLKITPQIITLFKKLKNCILYNQYGPTEAHVVTELKLEGHPDHWPTLPSIGKPISNTSILILDAEFKPVPNGEIGELYISGICLAEGYLNNQDMTDEKFFNWESPEGKIIRVYRTGDIARYQLDGNIEFLGRQDEQVKISGHRIELAEVEMALNSITNVKQAVVITSQYSEKQTQLIAYIQSENNLIDLNVLRQKVSLILPKYMLPSFYVVIENFPLTSSGKIDRKSLPLPNQTRPDSAPLYKKPTSTIEKNITAVWIDILGFDKIGVDDNFFELGGTSLLAQKSVLNIRQKYNYKLPVTKLYQFPTIKDIASYLEPNKQTNTDEAVLNNIKMPLSKDVAIIGMSGKFPGAQSIDELWEVLKHGKETISFFSEDELDVTIPKTLRTDPNYVKARGIVPTVKNFDASFFGLNPKLAEVMDPQQRLFLEIAWETLEQSGHLPFHYDGRIGVYAGTGMNTYYKNNILPNKDLIDSIGYLQTDSVNEKDYIASRTAYHLNLKGPAVSVHSACSTSLLAIAEAVKAIRSGQCDIALAGGSNIHAPMHSGHLYQEGSILSPDGHCRPFDERAKGTVFSDGAGVILLKNLEAAKKDGDFIYGIVKGVGVNNDGGAKGSFSAPSVDGQAEAIVRAHHDAQVPASSISYIEAHGTATPLGDPIEIEGLQTAFGEQKNKNYCAIGSLKSNMGHLTAAAGVAGLIKTILALNYRKIPPSLGYTKPNPAIDFDNSPFYVNTKLRDWDIEDGARRAGISSFGVGGTNVHIVVEEYSNELPEVSVSNRPVQLVTWSAKTENSLNKYGEKLGDYLNKDTSLVLADVAYSLKKTRDNFNHRKFVLAANTIEALEFLVNKENNTQNSKHLKAVPNELIFLFPGQGAQYLQMGKALYEHEAIFRKAFDTCSAYLLNTLNLDIKQIIFPKNHNEDAENLLKDTQFTQPALFVIEYALAKLWMSWGVTPTAFCGHSIGEFVGAHLAGVFSLEEALKLITTRGKLVSALPEGSMLSVRLPEEDLLELLPSNLCIAAVNSDRLCVVSGKTETIQGFIDILKKQEIPHRFLATSHAFHSTMMNPVLETFKKEVEKINLKTPNKPIISTVTGSWLKDSEATDPNYWTNHLRATVQFSKAMDTILKLEEGILLEVGPGKALTTLASQKGASKLMTVLPSLPIPKENENAYPALLNTLGHLWLNGLGPDWDAFYAVETRQKLKLPSYVFDRKPCWINPLVSEQIINTSPLVTDKTHINGELIERTHNSIPMRKPIILNKISELILNASGIEVEHTDMNYSFLELGLDSLILTQIAIACKKAFNSPISFRQLNEELSTPNLLATHLDESLPAHLFAPAPTVTQTNNIPKPAIVPSIHNNSSSQDNTSLGLIAQQLQLLGQQVELLQGRGATINPPLSSTSNFETPPLETYSNMLSEEEKLEHKKPFGASPRIEKQSKELNDKQLTFLEKLISSYNHKTKGSKNYAQKHRANMADPRVVSGFKPLTKELIYPIVIEKSAGNKLWDIDGNQYIDALNGFGSSLFGHQPDFIKEALHNQIESGFEVGPQHPLAGEVCNLLCEFTGQDRAGLCNTGSEAVLGAMRIARTVTGRSLIVAFSGSYHGINDEGIVRGSKKMMSFPAAAGIMPEAVKNVLVLDYGTEESLNIIRERAHELAAVLVEPVQSRRPEFQPIEFLREVRNITTQSNTALIFDEVITGFRMHPGGIQGMYDIKADIGTYGKVIGGGLSIGAIVGKKEYMDALDGGHWNYGDDSYPDVGVTYFAGTFVRHPLALASAKASLEFMKDKGPKLQENLNVMTEGMAIALNRVFKNQNLPMEIMYFGSLWRLKFLEEIPYSELLFVLLREKGIHIWDGFPCFLTLAYTQDDINTIVNAFEEAIDDLVHGGIFGSDTTKQIEETPRKTTSHSINKPPVPHARLGIDEDGNPAWFVKDDNKKDEYIKINL